MFKKIIPFILRLLDSSNTTSVMRFSTILITATACFYVIGIFFTNDIIMAVNTWMQYYHSKKFTKIEYFTIDWVGVATFIGAALVSKGVQSFAENKSTSQVDQQPG